MHNLGCGEGECVRESELYTGLIPGVSLVDSRPLPENDTWPRGNDPKSRLLAVLKMMMAGRHPNAEKRGQHQRCLVIGRIRFVVLNNTYDGGEHLSI